MADALRKDPREPLRIFFEGEEIPAYPGQSVAVALLAAGVRQFRATPVSGAPRGPYCLMGACHDCLVVADGMPNVQACLTEVRPGMTIARQQGARDPDPDGGPGDGPET